MPSHLHKTMGPAEWAMLVSLAIIWGGPFFFYAVAITALPTFTIVFLPREHRRACTVEPGAAPEIDPAPRSSGLPRLSHDGAPQQCHSVLAHRLGAASDRVGAGRH